jgi:hypothetical protein
MTIAEAREFVNTEIAKLERVNSGSELRPWIRDACPAAPEYWGRIQQRIALSHPRPNTAACSASLDLRVERSDAQIAAAEASGARLAAARRIKAYQEGDFPKDQATDSPADGLGVI